jgi:hypothetical protein
MKVETGGGYRLPRGVETRLAAAARDLRNGDAVMALARFLGRFHTAPAVLGRAFPVDRAALAAVGALGLTEARVRGALKALEEIGFLVREAMPGSAYRPTAGGLRRKPILWRIAPDFADAFQKANATALRGRRAGGTNRRPIVQAPAPRPSLAPVGRPTAKPAALLAERDRGRKVSSGEQHLPNPNAGLEAALARLRSAVERGAA